MIALLGVLVTAASPNLDLAYSARYYFQGRKHSYHQIYLVNHTGKGKRQITHNEFESYAPMWVDRNHLAWVEVYQRLPNKGEVMYGSYRLRVVLLDLKAWKRKTVANLTSEVPGFGIWATANTFELNRAGPNYTLVPTTYKVSLNGIAMVPSKDSRIMDSQFGDDDDIGMGDSLGGTGKVMLKSKWGPWTLHWSGNQLTEINDLDETVNKVHIDLESKWKGTSRTFRLKGNHVDKAIIDRWGNPVIVTTFALEKYRHDNFLYRMSKDQKSMTRVSGKVGMIKLQEDRHMWTGHQVGVKEGSMGELDDGRGVYTFWLYVGDWKTGDQWTIADGLVEVTGSQFRPLL